MRRDEQGAKRPSGGRKIRFAALLLWLCVPWWNLAAPAEPTVEANRVKAAYVLRIAHYVEWPGSSFPTATAPIRVAVVGGDSFADVLEKTVKGRKIGKRGFKIERVGTADQALDCQVVVLGDGADWQADSLIRATRNKPVLTVSQKPGFARAGGRLNFVIVDERMRFEINQGSAKEGGLKVSSQLLSVAARVFRKTKQP